MKSTVYCSLCLYGFIYQQLEVKTVIYVLGFLFSFSFLSAILSRKINEIKMSCAPWAWIATSVFGGVLIALLFSFLCCTFCFVCLSSVSCVQFDYLFLIAPSVFSHFHLRIVNQNAIYVL